MPGFGERGVGGGRTMTFPLQLDVAGENNKKFTSLYFYTGCLTLLGPNGSGKTQLLRKIKKSINPLIGSKKIRYLSAGRMGMLEQYRSDFDGQHSIIRYDEAQFGSISDVTRRHQHETIHGDYQTLSVRADILIKVQERLRKLFFRNIFIEWDAGRLKVSFKRNDIDSQKYSSAREASGLIQLVAILAAIYDDEVGALLLDEPEVSLHPQLQSFLMKEIERYAGDIQQNKKLIILATHSTEFINISSSKDLCNIVFCYDPVIPPIQLNPSAGEFQSKKLNELISRIGQEHKLAFFSNRPLLVEGPSDAIICHGIEKKLDLFLEAAGVQIVPIIGKGEFPVVYKFFKMTGKEPIIITDADSFTDSMDVPLLFAEINQADVLAQNNGFSNLRDFIKDVYDDFCVLADSLQNSYKTLLESSIYWKNKNAEDDVTKIYRRAFFTLMFADSETSPLFSNSDVNTMRTRLDSLFSILNSVGCFILRKGTIETYYAHSIKEASYGKPIAAVEEVNFFNNKDTSFLISQYKDIVNCLQYASKTKEINEIEALKELLLATLAPILGSLKNDTTQSDVNSIIRSTIGEKGELFDIIIHVANKNKVSVNVNSKILEVDCFPFEIEKHENLVQVINTKLGLA